MENQYQSEEYDENICRVYSRKQLEQIIKEQAQIVKGDAIKELKAYGFDNAAKFLRNLEHGWAISLNTNYPTQG